MKNIDPRIIAHRISRNAMRDAAVEVVFGNELPALIHQFIDAYLIAAESGRPTIGSVIQKIVEIENIDQQTARSKYYQRAKDFKILEVRRSELDGREKIVYFVEGIEKN